MWLSVLHIFDSVKLGMGIQHFNRYQLDWVSTTQNIGFPSIISYDTIKDGQNKKSDLFFSNWAIQEITDTPYRRQAYFQV